MRIFVQLLASRRASFCRSGIGALKFENVASRRRIVSSTPYTSLSVPAKTCQARADFAVRLSTMYILSPNR